MSKINKPLSSLALIGRFSRPMTRLIQVLQNATRYNTNSRYRNPFTRCFHLPRPPASQPPIRKPTQSAVPRSGRRILQLCDPLSRTVCAPVLGTPPAPSFPKAPSANPEEPVCLRSLSLYYHWL